MCYKGKCFYSIPVEKGCYGLAVLFAVTSGLTFVASVIVGILIGADVIFPAQPAYQFGNRNRDLISYLFDGMARFAIIVLDVIVAVFSLISFNFSVVLCKGISNRRPAQVLAYFIYGVVITVLMVLACVFLLTSMEERQTAFLGLFGCVVYSLFLVMVHQTYSKLSDEALLKDHIRLVESSA